MLHQFKKVSQVFCFVINYSQHVTKITLKHCSFFLYCQNKLILASIHWCFLTLEIRFTVHWQCPFDEFTQLRSHSKIYYVSIFLLNCPHAQCLNKMGCILGSVREIKCDVMFESERKSSICCWTYFILCWNGFKKRMSKHSLWII